MADHTVTTAPLRAKADVVSLERYSGTPDNVQHLDVVVKSGTGKVVASATVLIYPGRYEGKLEYDLDGNPTFNFARVTSAGIGLAVDNAWSNAAAGFNAKETAVLAELVTRGVLQI